MENLVEKKLTELSSLLEVPVDFAPDEQQKVRPSFNASAILSKLHALMVVAGWPVSGAHITFHSVHADVEFWKMYFAKKAADEKPAEEVKSE